ncbi:MAG: hypothetical protein RRC34_04150 [Lentisphaeria bacterium]|nr:hypothetical protein [Lentisphaeria bacterium]
MRIPNDRSPMIVRRNTAAAILIGRLGFLDRGACREWHGGGLREILVRREFMHRQTFWTDSLAVGGAEWIESAAAQSGMKRYSVEKTDLDWPENRKNVFLREIIASKAI